jgi:hypothetical protein
MISRLRSHLTYANVVSTLCLFVLLGGGAYAAARLGKDTVGSKQIKAKAVKKQELADDAVTSTKVKDAAITAPKLADGVGGQMLLANFNNLEAGAFGDQNAGPVGVSSPGSIREMLTPQAFVATGLRIRLDGPLATGSREFVLSYFDYDLNQDVVTDLRCTVTVGQATCGSDARVRIPAESSLWFDAIHTNTSEIDYAEVGWRALPG